MKKDELKVGKRVQRKQYTTSKECNFDSSWVHGEIVSEYFYEPGQVSRGMGKVKVKWDNNRTMDVPINQLKEE